MFGGIIQSMRSTLRDNRNLLPKTGRNKKLKLGSVSVQNSALKTPKATEKQLKEIKLKAKRKSTRERLILFALFLIATVLFFFLMKNLLKNQEAQTVMNKNRAIEKARLQILDQQKTYLFYINDAQEWMQNQNYKNAILQYSNALDVFPNSPEVEFRLLNAYVMNCIATGEMCKSTKELLLDLSMKYPDEPRILYLKWLLGE